MENCVAPGLDEFDVIIRSCIVFSQSTYASAQSILINAFSLAASIVVHVVMVAMSRNCDMSVRVVIQMQFTATWRGPFLRPWT